MPHIEVDTNERQAAKRLIEFLKHEFERLSPGGKQVFVVMLGRHLGKELAVVAKQIKENQ